MKIKCKAKTVLFLMKLLLTQKHLLFVVLYVQNTMLLLLYVILFSSLFVAADLINYIY